MWLLVLSFPLCGGGNDDFSLSLFTSHLSVFLHFLSDHHTPPSSVWFLLYRCLLVFVLDHHSSGSVSSC